MTVRMMDWSQTIPVGKCRIPPSGIVEGLFTSVRLLFPFRKYAHVIPISSGKSVENQVTVSLFNELGELVDNWIPESGDVSLDIPWTRQGRYSFNS